MCSCSTCLSHARGSGIAAPCPPLHSFHPKHLSLKLTASCQCRILDTCYCYTFTYNPAWVYIPSSRPGNVHIERTSKHKMFDTQKFSHLKIMKQWRKTRFPGFPPFLSCFRFIFLKSDYLPVTAPEACLRDDCVQCSHSLQVFTEETEVYLVPFPSETVIVCFRKIWS